MINRLFGHIWGLKWVKSLVEDKFIKGISCGLVAGIAKDIPDFIVHNILKRSDISFWDYAAVLSLGYHPRSTGEHLFSIFFELLFSAILGLIYMKFIEHFPTRYKVLRGAAFGAFTWFALRSAAQAFHIRLLLRENLLSSAINASLSVLFGIVLELAFNQIERYLSERS